MLIRVYWTLAVAAGLVASAPAQAGFIGTVAMPDGEAVNVLTRPASSDDNQGFTGSVVGTFFHAFSTDRPLEVVFDVSPSGGTVEYDVIGVFFNADHPWRGMIIELGVGTGEAFDPTPIAGLDFDTPHLDSYAMFGNTSSPTAKAAPGLTAEPTRLVWSVDEIGPGSNPLLVHTLDVPDLGPEGYRFTVRYQPVLAPEPGSLSVALLGGVGLLARRRGQARVNSTPL